MLVVLKATIIVLILAVGLHAELSDVTYLWRRPVQLAKSLLAMYVVGPLAAVLLVSGFALPQGTALALVILAICAGAPLLPKKVLQLGVDPTYVFSLVVTTSLLAMLTVPLGVQVIGKYVAGDSSVTAPQVTVLRSFLLPLAVGMLGRAFFPQLAPRLGDWLLRWASLALGVCTIALLVVGWRVLLDIGLTTLIAFAGFTGIALVTGHALGGPEPSGRTSLAVVWASRHVGLALLVGAEYPGRSVLPLVAGYLLATMLVSLPYVRWRARVYARE